MNDAALRANVLAAVGMTGATAEKQAEILQQIEQLARKRIALAVPDMLSDEQLAEVEKMRGAGRSDDAILDWVEQTLPVQYGDLVRAVILDVANDLHY